LVDPPYNLTKQYGDNKFAKVKFDEYEIWFEEWIVALKRCLKPNSSIYVCTDWESSKTVQTVLDRHFKVRNRITWEREKGRGAKANWKNCSEDIWFATVSNEYHFDVDAVKLKRKVIYVYEDENGNEIEETKSVSMPPMSRAGNGYAAKSSRIAYGADELTYSNQLIHKPTGVLQPR
jgi:site-specific DNA-methyltransferase (adenine-specific)